MDQTPFILKELVSATQAILEIMGNVFPLTLSLLLFPSMSNSFPFQGIKLMEDVLLIRNVCSLPSWDPMVSVSAPAATSCITAAVSAVLTLEFSTTLKESASNFVNRMKFSIV